MGLKKVSKEVKEALKKEYGAQLKSLLLPLDDMNIEEIEVLAIIPSRSVSGQTMKFLQTDPKKAQEILVKNCIKTSKEEVMTDDGLFSAAVGLLIDLIPMRQGKFGKV